MSNYNSTKNENSEPPSSKDRLNTGHKINLAHLIVAFLGLVAVIIVGFKTEILGSHKTNPCVALKKKEDLKMKKIEDLVQDRKNCTDKDSIERYYDFEIQYANAELQNIQDSLKLCVN